MTPAALDSLIQTVIQANGADTIPEVAPVSHGGDLGTIAAVATTGIVLAGVGLGWVFAKHPHLIPKWRGWGGK